MTPGVLRGIPEDQQNLEKQIERQMGCMAGFLQLFDRPQIPAGKRLYSPKRLASSPAMSSTSPSERSDLSPTSSAKDLRSPPHQSSENRPSTPEPQSPAASPLVPLPVFDFKEGLISSWKLREGPRLSLDSRAIVDGKGKLFPREIRTTPAVFPGINSGNTDAAAEDIDKQRRSPSVVARLMGLDALPGANAGSGMGPTEPPFSRAELRRSASESRATRDLLQCRFPDGNGFPIHQEKSANPDDRFRDLREPRAKSSKTEPSPKASSPATPPPMAFRSLQKKSFFDAQDIFPDPSKRPGSLYGEIEKRLRMRGIDEPAKDLETLKQVLEALQLKGLLHHSKEELHQIKVRNLIHDHQFQSESPIVLMKPATRSQLRRNDSLPPRYGGPRRNLIPESGQPPARPLRERERNPGRVAGGRGRNTRIASEDAKSPSSLARRTTSGLNVDHHHTAQRRGAAERRISPVQSPKNSPRKVGTDPSGRSPRSRKPTAEMACKDNNNRILSSVRAEDEASTLSESSLSTSSQFDFERVRIEEYREGRSLLERCDKLLHSIAEVTSAGAVSDAAEQQPSPVSVLDSSSSFYGDEASPSPATKRCIIDFKGQFAEVEEEQWDPPNASIRSHASGCDFHYVTEILRASDAHQTNTDLFLSLEKRHQKADPSKASRLHRKLVFDTVSELIERKQHVSSWEAFSLARSSVRHPQRLQPQQVWTELQMYREHVPADDLCDVIRGVLNKDMAVGERGWGGGDSSEEMSDAVLDIERLIFKDLVAEAIRDLAGFSGQCRPPAVLPRRKLVF